jgi:hypothetical protein
LLTLLLVPVVYVALAATPSRTPDSAVPPPGAPRVTPSLSDAGARGV